MRNSKRVHPVAQRRRIQTGLASLELFFKDWPACQFFYIF